MTSHMSDQPTTNAVPIPGVPDDAPRSPDGFYWWDGSAWQLIPSAALDPVQEVELSDTFDPWGSGASEDISRGDPVLIPRTSSVDPRSASSVDSWGWVLALVPVLIVAGAFFHPLAALAAYGVVAIVSAVAVFFDVRVLKSQSYVAETFGAKMPIAALVGTPVAVPIYLHRRAKALDEESSKVLTWYVAAVAAVVFAVLGLTAASGSLFGELIGPEEVEPTSPLDWIEGLPLDENGNPVLPEDFIDKITQSKR